MTSAALFDPHFEAASDHRVALVHDFLVERGGAERVLLELCKGFPGASVHTALLAEHTTYEEIRHLDVTTLVPDPFSVFATEHRRSLPVAVRAFRRAKIDADVVIASTSGLSHLARSSGRRIIYCHTPARWLHRPEDYFLRLPPQGARVVAAGLRRWLLDADVEAVQTADAVLANSCHTAEVVREIYGVDAQVVRPASSLRVDGPAVALGGIDSGFFLTPSRLLSYKRFDVLFDAAAAMPDERFVVVGHGPLSRTVMRSAPRNVLLAGSVPEETLRWAYDACRAVVLTCADDFGLVPREAAAFGKVAVVPRAGGYVEQSGGPATHSYDYGSPEALAAALRAIAGPAIAPLAPTCDLELDRATFRSRISDVVEQTLGVSR